MQLRLFFANTNPWLQEHKTLFPLLLHICLQPPLFCLSQGWTKNINNYFNTQQLSSHTPTVYACLCDMLWCMLQYRSLPLHSLHDMTQSTSFYYLHVCVICCDVCSNIDLFPSTHYMTWPSLLLSIICMFVWYVVMYVAI